MNSLLYDFNQSALRKGEQTLTSSVKPEFSFQYDALNYASTGQYNKFQYQNEQYTLTEEQCSEIEAFIAIVEPEPVAQANYDALGHLAETDWYVLRLAETGVAIPTAISESRAAARVAIILNA
jgi:hypothetical protein|tara:strand:+ start:261 stop:629 length:369 start_codon:yes stop_codon:yes gene_type:complete